jgi:epoxyqueuosine reductase QueG
MVRGVERWYVDFDKCIPYFAEAASCGICIAVCPWTRPSVRPKLLTTMARRLDPAQEAYRVNLQCQRQPFALRQRHYDAHRCPERVMKVE